MAVRFLLPGYLQPFAGGRSSVELSRRCETVAEALEALGEHYPGVRDRVLTEQGEVRPHVNLFLNEESLRFARGLATEVPEGSQIVILPAVSGG